MFFICLHMFFIWYYMVLIWFCMVSMWFYIVFIWLYIVFIWLLGVWPKFPHDPLFWIFTFFNGFLHRSGIAFQRFSEAPTLEFFSFASAKLKKSHRHTFLIEIVSIDSGCQHDSQNPQNWTMFDQVGPNCPQVGPRWAQLAQVSLSDASIAVQGHNTWFSCAFGSQLGPI